MRFKKVKVNQTKLCWNEQDLYFHQKTIREYSVKHDSFFHTCLTFCKYVWEKPNLCVKYHTCSFWQMFDFYPTCLEKTKHVGIFTPGCYFPHMFGFWHIGMGKGTHVCKKPHNYMFANVWHFPHMCGKSHWHAYFPLSYGWSTLFLSSSSLSSSEHPLSSRSYQEWDIPVRLEKSEVQSSKFKVQSSKFKVQNSKFKVQSS